MYAKAHPDFITVTCLKWIPILLDNRFKNVVIDSLSYLTKSNRVTVYGFVIMDNHFHLLWQMMGDHKRENVQRDFLKYTGQQILRSLRYNASPILEQLLVNARDRKYQLWERNSLSIPIWTNGLIDQKLDYIHFNPVKAGLCKYPEEYRYSSAGFI